MELNLIKKYLDKCFILMPKRNGYKNIPLKKEYQLLKNTKWT